MSDELDTQTKLNIYKIVLSRYKNLISEKESHSVSEIREKVSPYTDFIRKLNGVLLQDIVPYSYNLHFMGAVQNAISYVRQIRTCEFAFTFWVDFKEMDELKIGTAMDKSILFAAIIRSFQSEDARVLVTEKGHPFVKFSFKDSSYIFVPESGSLMAGEDAIKAFSDDPVSYSFSDLIYENYEDK